jgi:NAD(P)-dependent dehydrogenase (short-subunit alcohol dehydrogenase family)
MNGERGGVVITGASRGIGAACAIRLDALGYRVFAGVRDAAGGDALRARSSDRLVPIQLDVTDSHSIASAAREIEQILAGAGLAGLVNNAGIAVAGPIEFLPIDALRKQLEVNVVGVVAVIQAFMPLLRMRRGRIVNISSISGRSALPMTGAYAASKFALEALSDALRIELRQWGMHVALVEPGVIATDIWETSTALADQMLADMPARGKEFYGRVIAGARGRVASASAKGKSPEVVVNAVVHALTARRPRIRYVIGRDARLRLLLQHLPVRWQDALIARALAKL